MPKVAGQYQAIVKVRKVVHTVRAESKEAAIRETLHTLASAEHRSNFTEWVNGGMEIVLVRP